MKAALATPPIELVANGVLDVPMLPVPMAVCKLIVLAVIRLDPPPFNIFPPDNALSVTGDMLPAVTGPATVILPVAVILIAWPSVAFWVIEAIDSAWLSTNEMFCVAPEAVKELTTLPVLVSEMPPVAVTLRLFEVIVPEQLTEPEVASDVVPGETSVT